MTVTETDPQVVYWRDSSPEADSVVEALRSDAPLESVTVVDTAEQFFSAIRKPNTQMIITHPSMVSEEILKSVESGCPDAVLMLVCDDEAKLADEVRGCA